MSAASLTVLNPSGMAWEQWSSIVAIDLSESYTLPNAVNERSWQLWATELLLIPGLSDLGLPDPRQFADWRIWAARFTQVAA